MKNTVLIKSISGSTNPRFQLFNLRSKKYLFGSNSMEIKNERRMYSLHGCSRILLLITMFSFGLCLKIKAVNYYKDLVADFYHPTIDAGNYTNAFLRANLYLNNITDPTGSPVVQGVNSINWGVDHVTLTIPDNISYTDIGIVLNFNQSYNLYYPGVPPVTHPYFLANPTWRKRYLTLLDLWNVNGLTITNSSGLPTNKANIKCIDDIYYGRFDNNLNPLYNNPCNTLNKQECCTGAIFLLLNNCKNVNISNLEVNGNLSSATLGGCYGDDGIQIGYTGIALLNSNTENITIDDVNLVEFGLDGLMVAIYTANPSSDINVELNRVHSNYNGRCGLSWTGGTGLTARNCEFNKTGKTYVANNGFGGGNYTNNPACGMDIEPDYAAHPCTQGLFENCEFIDNAGWDYADGEYVYNSIENVNFNSCTFHNTRAAGSLAPRGKKIHFNSCHVYGGMKYGYPGNTSGMETIFTLCDFEDVNYGIVSPMALSLVDNMAYSKKMTFDQCTFKVNQDDKLAIRTWAPGNSVIESDWTILKNCSVTFFGDNNNFNCTNNLISTLNSNVLYGCIFKGNNSITHTGNTGLHTFFTSGLIFEGGTTPCTTTRTELEGRVAFRHYNPGTTDIGDKFILGRSGASGNDGYSDFIIGNNSCLYTADYTYEPEITINKNSELITNAGGTLLLNNCSSVQLRGKIKSNNGSFLNIYGSTFPNLATDTKKGFYVHKNTVFGMNQIVYNASTCFSAGYIVSPGNNHFNSEYANSFPSLSTLCIDGGHANISGTYSCQTSEAVMFDGNNDYIKVINPSLTSKLSTYADDFGEEFSIEIAFKRDNNIPGVLFAQGPLFAIGINNNNKLYIDFPNYNNNYTAPVTYNTGYTIDLDCHFIVLRRNSSGLLTVYLDGQHIHTIGYNSSKLSVVPITTTTNDFYDIFIGSRDNSSGFFDGWIGQVRIWDRVLNSADLCYNYKKKESFDYTGITSDWDMIDGTGTVVSDLAPNPINGSFANGPTWVSQATVGDCSVSSNNYKTNDISPISTDNSYISELLLYPNPNNGNFTLCVPEIKNAEILIFDTNGKLVYRKTNLTTKNTEISTEGLAKGIYFLRLNDNLKSENTRFVIQ